MRLAGPVLALTIVYALALGSFRPLDLLAGALVSTAVMMGLGLSGSVAPAPVLARRAIGFPAFSAAVIGHVVTGTVQVVKIVLGLHSPPAGIIAVPIEERSDLGVAVAALALTVSPGEVLVEIDWARRCMMIHVVDASDPDSIREQHRRLYRRYQRRVFP